MKGRANMGTVFSLGETCIEQTLIFSIYHFKCSNHPTCMQYHSSQNGETFPLNSQNVLHVLYVLGTKCFSQQETGPPLPYTPSCELFRRNPVCSLDLLPFDSDFFIYIKRAMIIGMFYHAPLEWWYILEIQEVQICPYPLSKFKTNI